MNGPQDPAREPSLRRRLSLRGRLTAALVAAAILPLAVFGIAGYLIQPASDQTTLRALLFALAVTAILAVLVAFVLAEDLTAPLRAITSVLDRTPGGDHPPLVVPGDDELARLADSHNRLSAELARRDRELVRMLEALERLEPDDRVERLVAQAAVEAAAAFELIDADVLVGDPSAVPEAEVIPGESRPLRADLRVGGQRIGVLVGRLPATRRWDPADQHLFELFASEVAVAIRNAQLFARIEAQNVRLRSLDEAKDDFLRGIGHNLQTPLARIRAHAAQLAEEHPDRRLDIVVEQADRLSRMVRQLLLVSRLESGALRPRQDVIALGPRVRRAWEALGASETPFELDDRSAGWLAIADGDQLDQVIWALLDNAVRYGGSGPVDVAIAVEPGDGTLRLTVADRGPGVPAEDRDALFTRFGRGSRGTTEDGTGLGLYVSRELCRAMGGDLVLEDAAAGRGAAFSILLAGEAGEES